MTCQAGNWFASDVDDCDDCGTACDESESICNAYYCSPTEKKCATYASAIPEDFDGYADWTWCATVEDELAGCPAGYVEMVGSTAAGDTGYFGTGLGQKSVYVADQDECRQKCDDQVATYAEETSFFFFTDETFQDACRSFEFSAQTRLCMRRRPRLIGSGRGDAAAAARIVRERKLRRPQVL